MSLAATLNSLYIVDFNDSTPVNLAAYFNSTAMRFHHTFDTSGIYYVNLTMYNSVSVKTQIVQVRIYTL